MTDHDWSGAFDYAAGRTAYTQGIEYERCPHHKADARFKPWRDGWKDAEDFWTRNTDPFHDEKFPSDDTAREQLGRRPDYLRREVFGAAG